MASKIKNIVRDFVSNENRIYKVRLGSTIASSLAGIIAGVILASIVWSISLVYFFDSIEKICIR